MLSVKVLIQKALENNPEATNREITDYVGEQRKIKYKFTLPGSMLKKARDEAFFAFHSEEKKQTQTKRKKTSLIELGEVFFKERTKFLQVEKTYERAKTALLKALA